MHTTASGTSVGIVTINAQYAHTHPGIRILRNIALDAGLSDAWIREFTLSDPIWKMAEAITSQNPKLLGISISIWNRDASLALARRVKSILPNTLIIAGGPETWFDAGPLDGIDCIIPGEAEEAWSETLRRKFNLPEFSFSKIVEPYRDCDLPHIKGRMVYLETSRGCPFQCGFCQSGRRDARCKSWSLGDAQHLACTVHRLTQAGAHTIKFLDRTFNAQPQRALEYFKALAAVDKAVCHFEICAELLDRETIAFLATVPAGKFQFEIGIQSLNPDTLKAIGRRTDTHLLFEKLRHLLNLKTVHVHADLIWGLPLDTFDTIVNGFNVLHDFGLDELQLGFLKFLRGAPIENDKEKFGYRVETTVPYEALSHHHLSGHEMLELRKVEYVFNRFHNSKRFVHTIRYLLKSEQLSPFAFYQKIATVFAKHNLFLPALTVEKQCEILHNIFNHNALLLDYLRLDYTCSQKVFTLPRMLTLPNAKPPAARQEKNEHSICVAFEHAFDARSMTFEPLKSPAVYKVTHKSTLGYYSSVTVQRNGENS